MKPMSNYSAMSLAMMLVSFVFITGAVAQSGCEYSTGEYHEIDDGDGCKNQASEFEYDCSAIASCQPAYGALVEAGRVCWDTQSGYYSASQQVPPPPQFATACAIACGLANDFNPNCIPGNISISVAPCTFNSCKKTVVPSLHLCLDECSYSFNYTLYCYCDPVE